MPKPVMLIASIASDNRNDFLPPIWSHRVPVSNLPKIRPKEPKPSKIPKLLLSKPKERSFVIEGPRTMMNVLDKTSAVYPIYRDVSIFLDWLAPL